MLEVIGFPAKERARVRKRADILTVGILVESKRVTKTPRKELRTGREQGGQTGQEQQWGALGVCCWLGRGRRALRLSQTSHRPSALEHTRRRASYFLSFRMRLTDTHRNHAVNQSNARQRRQFRAAPPLQTAVLVQTAGHRITPHCSQHSF